MLIILIKCYLRPALENAKGENFHWTTGYIHLWFDPLITIVRNKGGVSIGCSEFGDFPSFLNYLCTGAVRGPCGSYLLFHVTNPFPSLFVVTTWLQVDSGLFFLNVLKPHYQRAHSRQTEQEQ